MSEYEESESLTDHDDDAGAIYNIEMPEIEVSENETNVVETVENEPKKFFSEVLDWASCLVYAVAAVLALNLFFFRSITVSGDSMNDTLTDKDLIIATNFMYTPHYGDIVIIQADKLRMQGSVLYGETIIKRVIATAGDTVRIDFDNGVVYRNGEAIEEDYIKEPVRDRFYGWVENNMEYKVPENCVFVMGDNRNRSNDSRNLSDVGFIDVNYIMGKALVRYAPFSKFKWL